MELHILEHSLKVASIEKEGIQTCTHGLIKLAFLASKTRCKFFSLTETPEDYTIIVDEEGFKELPQSENISVADATWLALNVVSGGGNASNSQPIGVTKIAKSVIAPLADHNISVFMLSTYQTDFILVRERDLPMVMHTLSSEFTLLRVVNGETVAAHNLGVSNGFVKPKLGSPAARHPPPVQPQQHVLCDQPGPRHAVVRGNAADGRHVLLRRDEGGGTIGRRLHPHPLLLLLADRGLHLSGDGRADGSEVSEQRPVHQRLRRALEDGSHRRTAAGVRFLRRTSRA
ncbi:cytosolic arginine sensor for mTORC1 subunit 2 isoform X3 [Antennarius striatus]|uniref:cytosolic arginine sensor for mTORC1 subunit 2 isoform X3 n=1 Tax=Antennarius striatus TaxID=241820 RepID=UPI0035B32C15